MFADLFEEYSDGPDDYLQTAELPQLFLKAHLILQRAKKYRLCSEPNIKAACQVLEKLAEAVHMKTQIAIARAVVRALI